MLKIVAGISGLLSQVVAVATLVFVLIKSPWFRWLEHNLSILGVEGSARVLFNVGIGIAGILGIVFAVGLKDSVVSGGSVGWVGIVSLALGSAALAVIGLVPRTTALPHNIATVAFFVLIALAVCLVGVQFIMGGRLVGRILSIAAAVFIIGFQVFPWPTEGGAIPQLLSCVPWSAWTLVFAVRLLVGGLEGTA
jgi:hypothetical membrane protein